MEEVYGLIGKKLSHSFSQTYFSGKFEREGFINCNYELFEIQNIEDLIPLLKNQPNLKGLNVTIPYKEAVLPYLSIIDPVAKEIGAVNVIKVSGDKLEGYNSDYFGFKASFIQWLGNAEGLKALVLGTGGASKAIIAALKNLGIDFQSVSQQAGQNLITYDYLTANPSFIKEYQLIINTTPLGMYPEIESTPDLPYELISSNHYFYDLVYNPEVTQFLALGRERGAKIKNGLEMLELQAEKSWEIWQSGR